MSLYQSAQDAAIKVDGFDITSSTNTFEDAMAGVTLNVSEVTTSPFTLKIEPDTSEIEDNIKGFVDSYNEIMDLIKSDNTSSSTLRSLQMQFGMMVANEVSGLNGTFSALSQIGISTSSNGRISLDSDDLKEALAKDTQSVAKLFAGTDDESVEGIADQFDSFIESYISSVDGILTAQESGLNKTIRGIEDSIMQENVRIDSFEKGLKLKFTQMELNMNQLSSQGQFMSSQSFLW
jgi:flagellar hook-associated protein 2